MSQVCSIFLQLLKLFPRSEFEQAVRQHRGERHARGFTCWGQFVAMLFCHLGRAQSLREICGGLAASEGKLRHLGLSAAPARSTLAYANRQRPWPIYETVFGQLLAKCRGVAPGHKFRFKNKLLSLDASIIDLCASLFDWAQFQRAKGAVKLHLVLDHDGYLPSFCVVTDGKTPDLAPARKMSFAPGTIVVFDRGYTDYQWFADLDGRGVFFVTRLTKGADYEVLERRALPSRAGAVRRDEVIFFPSLAGGGSQAVFRRIEYFDAEQERTLVFLTNHLKFAAATIAAIYKERWQVELFFKALKQNLRVKTFVGTSANALKIQIWTALIAMLLLRYLKLRARWGWSLSNLVALLRQQLFVHRELYTWLDEPFHPPPESEEEPPRQLLLAGVAL